MDNLNIAAAFNRAAHCYDEHSSLQQGIGEHLIKLLPDHPYRRTLDLGCGSGLTTRKLFSSIHCKQLDAMDISTAFIASNQNQSSSIHYFEQDFDSFTPAQHYDLIFSNMALQWSNDLTQLITRYFSRLKRPGLFAFSIPLQDTLRELIPYFSINQFESADILFNFFSDNRISIRHFETQTSILSFANTRDALHSIKKVGANYTRTRTTRRPLKSFLLSDTINQLTYHIGYFILEKSA